MGVDILAFESFYSRLLDSSLEEDAFPPALLSRYRITACLCETGEKRVYIVSRRSDGVAFILKGTTPERGDSAAREAELLLQLDHPGIPKAVETFTWQGWDYLVRQYFEGRTLDNLIAHSGPLPAGEVLRIGAEVAGILRCLHDLPEPLIHRDIKPQNLIQTPGGAIRLIDFGIARKYNREYTRDTVYLGSLGYAPPEQFGFTQTDPRTDIYAIGGLMYFLATGRQKEYLSDLGAVSPRSLRRIITRCTRLEAGNRYQDVRRLQAALRGAKRRLGLLPALRRYGLVAALTLILSAAAGQLWSGVLQPALGAAGLVEQAADSGRLCPILARAVRQSLRLEDGVPLTEAHLAEVRSLHVAAPPESGGEDSAWFPREPEGETLSEQSLLELSLLPNLADLTLTRQDIRDITALSGLRLTRLELTGNNVTSLEPLRNMTTLRELSLGRNPVADLSPIASLSALTSLDLSYTEVMQLAPIARLTGLRSLDLRGAKVTDLAVLGELGSLETLRLAYTSVKDFSFLERLTELRALELLGTGFGDMGLLQCENLQTLDVSWNYNFLTSIEGIERFSRLESLDLSFTGVMDLAPLERLPALHTLGLHSTRRELPALPALRRLVITGEEDQSRWEELGRLGGIEVVTLTFPTAN